MTIIRAAVGGDLQEFGEGADRADVWTFVNMHTASSEVAKGIVLMDDSGATIGEIWDGSQYFAHWETPEKMRAYFYMICFDQNR
jgi:hypothetical protein